MATDAEIIAQNALNGQLNNMLDGGRGRMLQLLAMQRDAIRYLYGDQIRKNRKKGWDYPVLNRIYSDLFQEIAMLSANNPRIDTPPREDTDIEVAKSVGQVLKGVWSEVLHMRIKVIAGLLDDHLCGIKIAKCFWEPQDRWDDKQAQQTGKGWKGQLRVNVLKPHYFGCDPDVDLAIEIPTRARYVWTERYMDKRDAAARWPKYKQHLKDLGEWDELQKTIIGSSAGVSRGGSTIDETGFDRSDYSWSGRDTGEDAEANERALQERLANFVLGGDNDEISALNSDMTAQDDSLVLVQEFYFRDYATTEEAAKMEDDALGVDGAAHYFREKDSPFILDRDKPIYGNDEAGAPTQEVTGYEQFNKTKDTWPQTEVRAAYEAPKYPNGRFVLRLGEQTIVADQPWPYERWPFAVAPAYLMPHRWEGPNFVEMSRGYQDWMNEIASHLTMYIKFFSDPVTAVEQGALARGPRKKKKSVIPNWAGAVLRLRPGKIDRVKRFEPPALPQTIFQIFEMFKIADQDQKGVHDIAQGRQSKGDQTLGELNMLNRNTRQRIGLQGVMLDEWLKQIALCVVELMQRHYTVGDWVRYTGDEPEAVQSATLWTQEMASAKFDVILEPVSTLPYDDEREAAKYMNAYGVVGEAMLEELLVKLKIQNIPEIMQKHQIVGPLVQLMEMAGEQGMAPEQLFAAIMQQLKLMQSMSAESQGGPQQTLPNQGQPQPQQQKSMANDILQGQPRRQI